MPAGLASLSSPLATAAYQRFMQLSQSGMPNEQIIQTLNQEGIMPPLGELAAKLMAVKNAAQQPQMPPQATINQQLDQQLQAAQNPQPQQPMPPQGAAPQGQPAPQGAPMPPQGMPPQGAAPQPMPQGMPPQPAPQGAPMPPQGMAAGGLASIPVHNVGDSSKYASGGIVAFNGGGDVQHFDGLSGSFVGGNTSSGSPFDRSPGFFNVVRPDELALAQSDPEGYIRQYGRAKYDEAIKLINQRADQPRGASASKLTPPGQAPIQKVDAQPVTEVDADTNALVQKHMNVSNPYASVRRPNAEKIYGDFDPTVDIEDYTSKVKSAEQSAKAYRDDIAAYEKEHGIGKAQEEYIDYLSKQKDESDKDYKFNKSMALAEFGFTLASTPGSFLQGMAKSGSGLAKNMMEVNAQKKAADGEYQKALLQAKAAKEAGDMETYKDSLTYGRQVYKEGQDLASKMADHVRDNKQLFQSYAHNRVIEGEQAAQTDATLAGLADKRATTQKVTKLLSDPAFNALSVEKQQDVLNRVTMPEQLSAGLTTSALSSSRSNDRIILKAQYDAAVKERDNAIMQDDPKAQAAAEAKMQDLSDRMNALSSSGISSLLGGSGGLSTSPSVGGSSGTVVDFNSLK
jgi:hypothetical protein